MNGKVVKIIGITATLLGMGVSLVSDWVADKKLDDKIENKLAKALAEKATETES